MTFSNMHISTPSAPHEDWLVYRTESGAVACRIGDIEGMWLKENDNKDIEAMFHVGLNRIISNYWFCGSFDYAMDQLQRVQEELGGNAEGVEKRKLDAQRQEQERKQENAEKEIETAKKALENSRHQHDRLNEEIAKLEIRCKILKPWWKRGT